MPAYAIDGVIPVVHPRAFVHPTASLIGDVEVGADCYIGPHASLRGDFGRIIVGEGANVQDSCVIHAFPGQDAVIRPNGHIGHSAVLHGCTVGSFALVGIGAIVLDGAEIGDDALVAAGSLVPAQKQIPPRMLALGRPVQIVRELDDDTLEWKRNGVRVYQNLAARSLATLVEVAPLPWADEARPRVSTGADVARPLHERRGHQDEADAPT
ncbi:gamma carbonic anhydrase family protein [Salinibacterium sp. ZJ70]|uniref:gamma carbonic anhydrase family protein n=1 Tax=Salinibacterium sp. ZJ70 TaxID=2708084 RepID=UPI001422DB3F|nr:phenylacetic acid degradation protein PaaY [Salinibacterium sp. ZJ70]